LDVDRHSTTKRLSRDLPHGLIYFSDNTVRIIVHESALAFLARIEPSFASRELEHHLILGVANTLPPATFLTVERGTDLHAAAIFSAKRPLILSVAGDNSAESLETLAEWMPSQGYHLGSFIADVPHAEVFAQAWKRLHRDEPRLKLRQRLHSLTSVDPIVGARGQLVPAAAEDIDLLTEWQRAFNQEAMGDSPDPELRDALEQRVEDGEMYLWIDGEARNMAASARPTRHGVAINSVYTPPKWRGRGYATACVAALSRRMLEGGKRFCVLYTDLANPTSNAIYPRIGYHPVSDSLVYELRKAPSKS
jgi:predicted GNAT family acetyltransferase